MRGGPRQNEEDTRLAMPDPSYPVPPAPKPFAADRVIGDYEIKGELDRGGMGVVYHEDDMLLALPVQAPFQTPATLACTRSTSRSPPLPRRDRRKNVRL